MIRNYLKTAIRNLFRNKVYSIINITGLSLGLATAMLIILYVKDEISFDRFHKNSAQIYRIDRKIERSNGEVDNSGYSGYFQGPSFAAGIPEIKEFVRFQSTMINLQSGDDILLQEAHLVDSNFLSAFSFPLLSGNRQTALLQPNTIVITEDLAKKQFGTSDVLGRTLLIKAGDKFEPYAISGVARNTPENSSIRFQVLMPIRVSMTDEQNSENWFNFFLNSFVVLHPNADIHAVETKMQKVFEQNASESIKKIKETYGIKNLGLSYFLQPLTDIHLSKKAPADGLSSASNPMYSYILSGIALFILLIACINFINLTVARSVKRAKEIGVRKVIGGDRKQLMLQFMGESFVLCLAAFILSILLVQVVLPLFNQLANKSLALSYLFDAKLIGGYFVLFFLTGLLAGFYPALVLSGYNPVQTLYSRFTLGGKNYLQKFLVVTQFTVASFLIIGTLTIYLQFNFLTTQKLGYDDRDLITIERWETNHNEASLFKAELLKNPNIIAVAPKNNGFSGNTVKVGNDKQVNITIETIDSTFFSVLNIPIIKGRNFSSAYPSDPTNSVLVNETFVKEAGWQDAIGKQIESFDTENPKRTVIGVVKDYHFQALTEKIIPQVFTTKPENMFGMFYIKIKSHTETASLSFIEKTFKKQFPFSAYSYSFKQLDSLKSYESEAKWEKIILLGAILTIFISCIGLFGLTVSSAERRTKEIGIRKVLGASVPNVVRILSKDFLRLVLVALTLAIPTAWIIANNWLQNYPYRITLNWGMFAIAGLMIITIALFTISFQAIRAAVANPVTSLRSE